MDGQGYDEGELTVTGIFMRVHRAGSWQNIDIVDLTKDELTAVFEPATKERVILFLAAVTKWMRENLVEES